jgi:hypothetical protein
MALGLLVAQDVLHGDAAHDQRIGNQGAVAAPGDRLDAHQRGPLLPGPLDECVQGTWESP